MKSRNYFSLVLFFVFLTFGCTDLYKKDVNTDLEFKIQIPKTRNAQTEAETLKLVVKLSYKDEDTSFEKIVYSTSEKTETITFQNVEVGSEIKISASVFDTENLLFFGETEYKKVEPTNNIFTLTLEKVYVEPEIIDAQVPEISIPLNSIVELATPDSANPIEKQISIGATVSDGGDISFQWQEKVNNAWQNIDGIDEDQVKQNNITERKSYLTITIEKGNTQYYQCIITNTNENANGEKTARITSDEVTVAYFEGELSIKATYNSEEYEIFEQEFLDDTNSYDYSVIDIEETYSFTNGETRIFQTQFSSEKYSIAKTNEAEKAIGYVPYTVTYKETSNSEDPISTTVYVPVKYDLSKATFSIVNSSNSVETLIPQYTGEETLQPIISLTSTSESSTIYLYNSKDTTNASEYQIENDIDISWLSNSSIITNSEAGTFEYTATATSKENAWCFGSISSNHTVTVCPWEIAIKDGKGEADLTESKDNLDGYTTYTLSVTNEAEENPSVTWTSDNDDFTISRDSSKLSTPVAGENAQTATITATVDQMEVASIKVTVAAKLGSEANPITTWTGLVTEMQNEGDAVYISGEMTADETLLIAKSREIIAVGNVTINRASNYTGAIFTLNAPLTMTGSESAHITIDGNNMEVGQSMIYSTDQNITLKYVTIQNCKNTATYGGAIYLGGNNDESNANELSIELSNCAFTNNTANGTSKGGGAIALNGKKITSTISNCSFNDNSASDSGGAIYIFGSGTENKQYTHTLENCTFSKNRADETNGIDSDIYLCQGATIIDNLSFENDTVNYDIYVYDPIYSYTTLKNKNMINKFGVIFGSQDTPEITLDDSFSTDSQINFECIATDGASVDSGDTLITTTEGNLLTQEEIDCFTITDTEGVNYTLNTNGTLSTSTNSSLQTAYYVSADGNDDNDGVSIDTPFKTLKNAITKANNSGINQIYVIGTLNATSEGYSGGSDSGPGEAYSAFYIQDENLGSEENPLIIEGYDDTATLSADYDDSESNVRVFATKNSCYITMKNLTITGGTTTGSGSALYYYGGVLTLEDCVIEGNSSSTKSDSGLEYDVYMYYHSKLNLTGTECYDGIYLSSSSAYFGDDCLLGYNETENTPIMHIDSSTVSLSGSVSLFASIYSDAKNPIYIDSALTAHTSASTGSKVSVVLSNYAPGTQIVSLTESSTANLEEETAKFYLQDEKYAIDTSGQIISQN